jgi:hypothetical protein
MKVSSDIEGWYITPEGYKNSHFPGESTVKFTLENSTHHYVRGHMFYEYNGSDFQRTDIGTNNKLKVLKQNIGSYTIYSISNLIFVIIPGFMRVFSSNKKITNIKIEGNTMTIDVGETSYTVVTDTNSITELV